MLCLLMNGLFILHVVAGNTLPTPIAYIPQGIESVNGSSTNLTCSHGENCLLDGHSPYIDTSHVNWASDLVTVRKNKPTDDIGYDHVVLTFSFDEDVRPKGIEIDFFLCPKWKINAPYISLYSSDNSEFTATNSDFIVNYEPSQVSRCSLSTVVISIDKGATIWHIVVSFGPLPNTEWVHVGEVRFPNKRGITITSATVSRVEPPQGDAPFKPSVYIPQGIESVNGSSTNLTCSHGENCLLDGHSPYIDTSLVNWASDLVTVRKNGPTNDITYHHVVLTFAFDKDVTLTGLEIDLFLCTEWGIHAPFITIYCSNTMTLSTGNIVSKYTISPSHRSCDCISTVVIPIETGQSSYPFWHIVVKFFSLPTTKWVHVGEVRFLNTTGVTPGTFSREEPSPGDAPFKPSVYIPQGIESVNGSSTNLTCSHEENCLLDGHSPYIDTSLVNWASDLVTVKKNNATDDIGYDHVVLTFAFDEDVTLTGLEIDLFLCTEWGIHAPFIMIYGGHTMTLSSSNIFRNYTTFPSQIAHCSLSTVVISIETNESSYPMWHIVVSFSSFPNTEWVHVGEVRFLNKEFEGVTSATFTRVEPPPGCALLRPAAYIPQGIKSVNGSNSNLICHGENCLLNGHSPYIETCQAHWASDLVTVKKNRLTVDDQVVLTFAFDKDVTLTGLEIDLFLCTEWGIHAPFITIYGGHTMTLSPNNVGSNYTVPLPDKKTRRQIWCYCLSTVVIPIKTGQSSYPIWHIVVTFTSFPNTEWVFVGEVRFLNMTDVTPKTLCTLRPAQGNNTLKAYIPQGIESVNGSSPNMTCSYGENCLLDNHSPYLDTSQVNWASDLVTVRKNNATDDIEYDHVVLTFSFEQCVKMVAVEIDFFLCPQWGIHAPYLTLYGSNTDEYKNYPPRSDYAEQTYYNDFISNYVPIVCGCQNLSKVRILVERGERMHSFWHIVVSFPPPYEDIEWVHVKEVRLVLKTHRRDTDDVDDDDEQPTTNPDPTIEDSAALTTNVPTSTVHIITNDLSSPEKISSNYIPVPDSTNNETLPTISQTGVDRPQFTTTVTTSILPTAVPPGLESGTRTSILPTTTLLVDTASVQPSIMSPDDTAPVLPITTSLDDTASEPVLPATTLLDDTGPIFPTITLLDDTGPVFPTTMSPDDTALGPIRPTTVLPDDTGPVLPTTTSPDDTAPGPVLPTTTSPDDTGPVLPTTTLLDDTGPVFPTTTLLDDIAPGPVLPTTMSPDDTGPVLPTTTLPDDTAPGPVLPTITSPDDTGPVLPTTMSPLCQFNNYSSV